MTNFARMQSEFLQCTQMRMTWMDRFAFFSTLDGVAVCVIVLSWWLIGWRIEHSGARRRSTSQIMSDFRREWMRQMITRQPRIFDAQVVASLRQGTAFFASTAVIALGGVFAVIGNSDRVADIANDLTLMETPVFVWEIKLVILMLFLINAFLKFAWANRLFGYAAVVMAAVPNEVDDPLCVIRANQAAEVNIAAARSFNRGLRSIYFGLTSVAWLVGPIALLLATAFTIAVIWRREFASQSRTVLLGTQT